MLVPVDLSDTSRGALLVALSWASALRASREGEPTVLTALYAGLNAESVTPGADRLATLEREVAGLRDVGGRWAGVDVRCAGVAGQSIPETIARYAIDHDAELVVLGTRGLGLDPIGRLGSVAGETLRLLPLPLLLVPPAVWLAHAPSG